MKIMHLSDLHLGIRLNDYSLQKDQEYILEEILKIVDEEKPEAVIIAGDIYDKTTPSEEAMALWDNFLEKLVERKLQIFIISGNHDSAIRLGEYGKFLADVGIHFAPKFDGNPCRITLTDEYGNLHLHLLPFARLQQMRSVFDSPELENYSAAVQMAVSKMEVETDERNILVTHHFITGSHRTESEMISVGGIDNVDVSVFEDFDYVALGHIHSPQKIGRETIRYCGTPLKYSLSERADEKSVTLIEMKEKGNVEIKEIPLIPLRDVQVIRGSFEEVMSQEFRKKLNQDNFFQVILDDKEDVINAMGRLREVYPHILGLVYANKVTHKISEREDFVAAKAVKTPLQMVEEFFKMRTSEELSEVQLAYLRKCLEELEETEDETN